jgi:transcriptional regulator with XRE-family HTH domain
MNAANSTVRRARTQKNAEAGRPSRRSPPILESEVGTRLRQLRKGQGLSLRALAEMSELSFNTVSLIENGKNSPSVSTLQRLAGALHVPVASFFDAHELHNAIVSQKKDHRPKGALIHGTMEDLCAGSTMRRGQVLVVTLEPGADSGEAPIVHPGHDVVYCLEGRLTYVVDGRTYGLSAGDSLVFEGSLPHRWANESQQRARSLLVICPQEVTVAANEFGAGS